MRGGFDNVPMTVNGAFYPVVGDFGGDNYDDIFWYRPGSGSDPLWISVDSGAYFDKSRTLSVYGTYSPLALTDYRFAPGQDFKDDIFFYAAGTTPDTLWHFADSEAGTFTAVPQTVNGTFRAVVGDYDGNGSEDIVWYAPGTAPDAKWLSNDSGSFSRVSLNVNGTYQPVAVLEETRDGIFWFGSGSAPDAAWRSADTPTGFETRPVVQYGDITGAAYQLGLFAVMVYGPSGPDVVYIDIGAGYDAFNLSPNQSHDQGPGLRPLVGDFDDDQAADIFWYGPGSTPDSVWYSQPVPTATGRDRPTGPPKVRATNPDSR